MSGRVLVVLVLLLGCRGEACTSGCNNSRHAQWLAAHECVAFCKNYGGIYGDFLEGFCMCVQTKSDTTREGERLAKDAAVLKGRLP